MRFVYMTSQNTSHTMATEKPRVAYTINGWQPVRCTLISEEPLFYEEEEKASRYEG